MANANGEVGGVMLASGDGLAAGDLRPVAPGTFDPLSLRTAPGVDPLLEMVAIEEWFERFRALCTALAAEARDESKRRFED